MSMKQLIGNRFAIKDLKNDLIGQGTIGSVYRGTDLQTDETIAIKVLRLDIVSSHPEIVARFMREGKALSQLNHHNIVNVIEMIEEDNQHYLIIEYAQGGSLRDLLREQKKLPQERVLQIGIDLADALARSHHLQIIHRDLKPANVLLASDGNAQLSDFGATLMVGDPRLTKEGILGTPLYLSPEAIKNESLDGRTDIWALGVMLYEMMAGEAPFGQQSANLIAEILSKKAPDLFKFCPDANPHLVNLIDYMLVKDRNERIPNAQSVGVALRAILENKAPILPEWSKSTYEIRSLPAPDTNEPMTMPTVQWNVARLRQMISQHFNREDIRTLCFDLALNYDELGGEGLSAKIRELILYMQRQQRLPDLLAKLKSLRTFINWPMYLGALESFENLPLNSLPLPGSLPSQSRMPLHRNPLFVGREDELKSLAQLLKAGETVAVAQIVAATGLGGIGKTQLAVEFVYRYGRFFPGGVFWLNFEDPGGIRVEIAACGGLDGLKLPNFEALSLTEQVKLVQRAWREPASRLLIFDNCQQENLLNAWLPSSGGCHVLVTSRSGHWDPSLGITSLALDILSRTESMNLLQRIVGDKIEIVSAELEAIAAELGDLPLALHLAGNFLAQYGHRISPSQYVQQLQEQKPLEHLSLTGHGLIISPTGHELHIAQTFALSYEQLDATKETDVLAQALLGRAAFFAPEPIPYDLLLATLKLDMRDWQTAILAEDGLLRLLKLGLLKSEKLEALLLHRLVAEFAKYHAHETAEASVKEIVYLRARQLNEARDPTQLLAWQTHLRFIADASREQKDEQTARIYNELGQHFWQIGDFKEAQPYYEKALAIRQTIFGEEHAETAESLNNLGALLRDKGQLDDARSYFEKALQIREELLGQDHPDTAQSLNEWGRWLYHHQDTIQAQQFFERALSISHKALADEHALTADYLNNLGMCLARLGNLQKALEYLEQALAIRKKALGEIHVRTALSLNNVGYILWGMNKLSEAAPYYEQALLIRQEIYGNKHPETIQSMNNLGKLFQSMNALTEARLCFEQLLPIAQEVLGKEHPHMAVFHHNLGTALQAQEYLIEAQRHLRQAIIILQKNKRHEHPDMAASLDHLGQILFMEGAPHEARQYIEQALAIRRKLFGENNAQTIEWLNNLGSLLVEMGFFTEAQAYLEQALASAEEALDKNDAYLANVLDNLGILMEAMSDLNKAKLFYERALSIFESNPTANQAEAKYMRDKLTSLGV